MTAKTLLSSNARLLGQDEELVRPEEVQSHPETHYGSSREILNDKVIAKYEEPSEDLGELAVSKHSQIMKSEVKLADIVDQEGAEAAALARAECEICNKDDKAQV